MKRNKLGYWSFALSVFSVAAWAIGTDSSGGIPPVPPPPPPPFHQAVGLTCSNPEGTLHYARWNYAGGVPPYPGMTTAYSRWYYKGALLGESVSYSAKPPKISELGESFDGSSRINVDLSHTSDRPSGSETYAIRVSLSRGDGGTLFPDDNVTQYTGWFVCTGTFQTVPVP